MKKLFCKITNHPVLIIIIYLSVLIPCFIGVSKTRINHDLLSYLPENLESIKGQKISNEIIGEFSTAFVVLKNVSFDEASDIERQISEISGVKKAVWLNSFFGRTVPSHIMPSAIYKIFRSDKNRSALMLTIFEENADSEKTKQAIEKIKNLKRGRVYITGASIINNDIGAAATEKTNLYVAVAVTMIIAVLAVSMRSFTKPLLILVSLGFAVVLNMGTNFLGEISFVTKSIAAVLQLGVTLDYSVFLSDRYEEEKRGCDDKKIAMQKALEGSLSSVTGSGLTTFFGFSALCFMSFKLGADIGIVMAKGVAFGVLTSLTLLPALLIVFTKNIDETDTGKRREPFALSEAFFAFFLKNRKIFATLFGCFLVCFGFLQRKTPLYYDLTNGLPKGYASVAALNAVRTGYGINTVHIAVIDKSVSEKEKSILSAKLKSVDGVSSVLSPQSISSSFVPSHILPESIVSVLENENNELFLIISEYNSGSKQGNEQVKNIRAILKDTDPNSFLTGEGAISFDTASVTEKDFDLTGVLALVSVFIIAAFVFKSFGIPFLIACAIECAVFVNLGIPALTGNDIPFIAPAIINCVQLGATVDYAILLVSRVKQAMETEHDFKKAIIKGASASSGSIIRSALIFFAATFSVFVISDMPLIKSVCLLLSRGAVISGAMILIFMPVCLSFFKSGFNKNAR